MLNWIEERTGGISALKNFLTEDVPGGASYWYVFGSATLIALVIQIITGIFLTFYYAPSAATAWESTKFIYDHVAGGAFVLSLHFWGASAMIALMTLHLLQVMIWGAYKKPREIMWVIGVTLFLLTLVLGLTGYLLPWDLNAYSASAVSIKIAGDIPIVGPAQANFLQDGTQMGTLTINRFFGIHVWLIPIALLGLVGLHLAVFRHNGAAGPPADATPRKFGRFFPDQIFMDTIASFVTFAVVVILAMAMPAPLLSKADPTNSVFVPSPAWYFFPLYGLLNVLPGNMFSIGNFPVSGELIGTAVVPAIFVAVLLFLPWIDRNRKRALNQRPYFLFFTVLSVAAVLGFGWAGASSVQQHIAASGGAGQTPIRGYGAPPPGAQEAAATSAGAAGSSPVALG
ncbi:MAG TPA: cytochrome bc complex cytochrome b subunit, partial [Candidatus Eremiobacteraceae bacterium]|nr:cytochrome bc complex cytochrome b subunit [Candidatus Eremiobacteraceae bacterium]